MRKKNTNNILISRFVHARKRLEMTQKEVAEALGEYLGENVPFTNVSMWERGQRPVPARYNDAICTVLGCSMDFLMGKNEELDSISYQALEENYSRTEISFNDLVKYDGRPLYIVFLDLDCKNGWALNDFTKKRFVFVTGFFSYERWETLKDRIRIYTEQPAFAPNRNIYNKKCVEMAQLLDEKKFYVVPCSEDEYIRGLYTGWYHHNENKTCLINETGLTLPYEGLGISYKAYSSTNTFTVENII